MIDLRLLDVPTVAPAVPRPCPWASGPEGETCGHCAHFTAPATTDDTAVPQQEAFAL